MPGYVYRGDRPLPKVGERSSDILIASPYTPERIRKSLEDSPKYRDKANEGFKCGSALMAVMHAIKGEKICRDCFRALRRLLEGRDRLTGNVARDASKELTRVQRKIYGI